MWKYLQYVFLVSSSTTSGLSLLFDLPILILSSPPRHQIHFGSEHLLLPPLHCGLLVCQKHTQTKSSSGAMTQEGNKGNTLLLLPLTKETSPSPGVESVTCPSGWRQAARCAEPIWEPLSACRDSLASSQRTGESAAWICCYLRPWIQESLSGWARARSFSPALPHSQPLFFSPLLSLSLCPSSCRRTLPFDSCDKEVRGDNSIHYGTVSSS